MADGKVIISTALDNTGLEKGIRNVSGSLGGLKNVLGKVAITAAAAFSIQKVLQFGAQCVELGSSVAEVQNVVDTAFGNMAYKMEDFADTAITSFGMSKLAAKQTGSTYMAMARSMGLVPEAASDMSVALTGLTGDVASFFNITQKEADTKIKSVFTGETEALKSLGVVMTQTNLDAYALANGFGKTTGAMTQAELVQLRYAYVTNALKLASGDFVKTQNSWANQTRILSMQWQEFMAVIGQSITTILLPGVRALNSLLSLLIRAANTMNSVISTLFGGQNKQLAEAASAADGAGSAISGVATAEDALADSAEAAGKAAKGSVAGFDELNVMQDSTSSAGASSTGSIGGSSLAEQTTTEQSALSDRMQAFVDKITALLQPLQEIRFEPLVAAFGRLREALAPFTQSIFAGLEWAYLNLFVPLARWTVEDALPAFLDLLSGTVKLLNAVLSALKPLGLWFWDKFLKPIAGWTGGTIVSALNDLSNALNVVSDWIDEHQGAVQTMTTTAAAFCAAWEVVSIGEFIVNAGGVVALLGKMTAALYAATVAKVADKLMTAQLCAMYVGDFVASLTRSTVNLAQQALSWGIVTAAKITDTAAQWAQIAATTAWNAICTVATAVTTAFGAAVAFLTSPIGLVILAIGALIAIVVLLVRNWDVVKATAINVWTGIQTVWQGACSWFKATVTDPLYAIWKSLSSGTVALWNDITSGIKNGFKGAVNFAIEQLNTLIGWVNRAFGLSWNGFSLGSGKLKISIPAGSFQLLTLPQIPYLAEGAVIPPNREFMAVLGDQKSGTNVEAPLSTIKQALREALAERGATDSRDLVVNLTATLDGQVIYRNQQKIAAGKGYPVGMNPAFD